MKFALSDLPSVKPIISYPVLAKLTVSGLVVLFTSDGEGTVMIPGGMWKLGEHSDSFSHIGEWTILPIGQTVTLSN